MDVAFDHNAILIFGNKVVAVVEKIGFRSCFFTYLIKAPERVVMQLHIGTDQDEPIFHIVLVGGALVAGLVAVVVVGKRFPVRRLVLVQPVGQIIATCCSCAIKVIERITDIEPEHYAPRLIVRRELTAAVADALRLLTRSGYGFKRQKINLFL